MCLIDENRDSPLIRDGQPVQQSALVEVVVVVAYDDVGPPYELLTQIVRAELMLAGKHPNGVAILHGNTRRVAARVRKPVIETAGQRT